MHLGCCERRIKISEGIFRESRIGDLKYVCCERKLNKILDERWIDVKELYTNVLLSLNSM